MKAHTSRKLPERHPHLIPDSRLCWEATRMGEQRTAPRAGGRLSQGRVVVSSPGSLDGETSSLPSSQALEGRTLKKGQRSALGVDQGQRSAGAWMQPRGEAALCGCAPCRLEGSQVEQVPWRRFPPVWTRPATCWHCERDVDLRCPSDEGSQPAPEVTLDSGCPACPG